MSASLTDLGREPLGILCHLVSGEKLRALRMIAKAQRGDQETQREAVEFFTDNLAASADRYLNQLEALHRELSLAYDASVTALSHQEATTPEREPDIWAPTNERHRR